MPDSYPKFSNNNFQDECKCEMFSEATKGMFLLAFNI